MSQITVRSTLAGWRLEADTFDNDLLFRRGGDAERAARQLAEHYAAAGELTALSIYLRDGSFGGRYIFRPR
jgi:hypothetical protein